jgi:capsular polysaccharide transport system permease protein
MEYCGTPDKLAEVPVSNPTDLTERGAVSDGAITAEEEAAVLTARAVELIKSEELAAANDLLNESISIDGGASGAHYWVAHILRSRKRIGDAIDAIRAHLQVRQDDVPGYLLWAECLMDLGRPKEAQGYVLKALALDSAQLIKPTVHSEIAKATAARCSGLLGRPVQLNVTKPDYNWIDWKQIEIPSDYRMSLSVHDLRRFGTSFLQSLSIHITVVGALIRREILTRFGRSRLGYLWAILQPVIMVGIMYAVFTVAGRRLPAGVFPIGFLLTGFVPFRFFAETRERVVNSIKGNLQLLYFRQVTLYSVIVARTVLEFLTNLIVFALLVGVAYLFGEPLNIRDPLEILWGIVLMTLLGLEFGLVVTVLSKILPAMENLSASISRVLFLISGLWFYANELPDRIRDWLLLNPIFDILEIIREGYFASYTAEYASLNYVHVCVLVGGVLALSLKRVMYHRLLDV